MSTVQGSFDIPLSLPSLPSFPFPRRLSKTRPLFAEAASDKYFSCIWGVEGNVDPSAYPWTWVQAGNVQGGAAGVRACDENGNVLGNVVDLPGIGSVKGITASYYLDSVAVLGEKKIIVTSLSLDRIKLSIDLTGLEVHCIAFVACLNKLALFGLDSWLVDLSSGDRTSKMTFGSPVLPVKSVYVDPNRLDVVYVCKEERVFQFDFRVNHEEPVKSFVIENFDEPINVTTSTFGPADLLAVNLGRRIAIYNVLSGAKVGEISMRKHKFATLSSFGDILVASLAHVALSSGVLLEFYQFSSPNSFLAESESDRLTGSSIKGCFVNTNGLYVMAEDHLFLTRFGESMSSTSGKPKRSSRSTKSTKDTSLGSNTHSSVLTVDQSQAVDPHNPLFLGYQPYPSVTQPVQYVHSQGALYTIPQAVPINPGFVQPNTTQQYYYSYPQQVSVSAQPGYSPQSQLFYVPLQPPSQPSYQPPPSY